MNRQLETVFLLAAIVPIWWWRGYVIACLWGWNVAETFGIREIGSFEGMGLATIVWCINDNLQKRRLEEPEVISAVIISAGGTAFWLLVGWCVYLLKG